MQGYDWIPQTLDVPITWRASDAGLHQPKSSTMPNSGFETVVYNSALKVDVPTHMVQCMHWFSRLTQSSNVFPSLAQKPLGIARCEWVSFASQLHPALHQVFQVAMAFIRIYTKSVLQLFSLLWQNVLHFIFRTRHIFRTRQYMQCILCTSW